MPIQEGTPGDDTLTGGALADTLFGRDGNDYLIGAGADDRLQGGDGNDRLEGGSGDDVLFGHLGFDEATYHRAAGPIRVNLLLGTAGDDGDGGTDTLLAIESVRGSNFNDVIILGDGIERARGNGGNDTLVGGEGSDQLDGGLGSDTLNGGNGNDSVRFRDSGAAVTVDLATGTATEGGDTDRLISLEFVQGSSFNDTLLGSAAEFELFSGLDGGDTINGRGGIDRVNFSSDGGPSGVAVDLALGSARDGFGNTDRLISIEEIEGTDFADTLLGGSGNDVFRPRGGADSVNGRAGFDSIVFGTTATGVAVDLRAGTALDGNGFIDQLAGIEGVQGTTFDDRIFGADGGDLLLGGNGNDRLDGVDGDDTIFGGNDSDGITGGDGSDTIDGGNGDDRMWGGNGDDTILGKDGDDLLTGLAGEDEMRGGNGNDFLRAGQDDDSLRGEAGDDTLWGDLENDTLTGDDGLDYLTGGVGDDSLRGGNDGDTLFGDDGADRIQGEAGNDTIFGGTGVDRLDGGSGTDTLSGGTGADDLVIGPPGSGTDLIIDFGAGDRLDARGAVTGFGASDDPDDFVRFTVASGDTRMLLNVDGAGSDFLLVAILDSVVGLNVTQLFDADRLLLD